MRSPGGSSERIVTFCGETDLAGASGLRGAYNEDENIRVGVFDADVAIALFDEGPIGSDQPSSSCRSLLGTGSVSARLDAKVATTKPKQADKLGAKFQATLAVGGGVC